MKYAHRETRRMEKRKQIQHAVEKYELGFKRKKQPVNS